jgi:two-component system sensor histidine kinase ChiS
MNHQNHLGTILLVDDIPNNLNVLLDFLNQSGFEVFVAIDGESALEVVDYAPPDIILLDIMMPDIDGFETCRRLKANPATQDIPVIFLSALSNTVDKVKGFELGAVDYITKPLQTEEVLARVTTHLTIRHLQKELQKVNQELEQRVRERTADLVEANAQLKEEIAERQRAYQKLRQTNEAYSRFVPKEFLQLLNRKEIIDLQLGDQLQMEMTILFADIRGFTTLSEQMNPQDNFNFINAYLKRVGPVIRRHNGFIDKYIGDEIMALFPTSPDDAVQAALDMQEQVTRYNQRRAKKTYSPIEIGIGVHSGTLMLGIIGEEERMEGTVISDAVNLASRMEGLTKYYKADIIISDETLLRLDHLKNLDFRFLGELKVKGKQEHVGAFQVFDHSASQSAARKSKTRTLFEEGVHFYQIQQFDQARTKFEQVLDFNPEDKTARHYLTELLPH